MSITLTRPSLGKKLASLPQGLVLINGNLEDCDFIIGNSSRLVNCRIGINSKTPINRIFIGEKCHIANTTFYMNGGSLFIGDNTTFTSATCMIYENKNISIGKDCMFSFGIYLRTSDAHSILNAKGERINFAEDILIGDHSWIGQNVTFLKGSQINNDTIVGASSVVTNKFDKDHVIIAGNPAHIIKENITWNRELL